MVEQRCAELFTFHLTAKGPGCMHPSMLHARSLTCPPPRRCLYALSPSHLPAPTPTAPPTPQEEVAKKPYQFLLVGVLREYLQKDLFVPTPFPFDRERVFDDFGAWGRKWGRQCM